MLLVEINQETRTCRPVRRLADQKSVKMNSQKEEETGKESFLEDRPVWGWVQM